MAASAKVVTLDNHNLNGEWITVLPRRSKQRKSLAKIRIPEEQQMAWVPTDCECDENRLSKLMRKMEVCIQKVEHSQFYKKLVEQIESPELLEHFHKVLGSELTMPMVMYGIGSIESYENPRLQLSLAILMKRKFNWIGQIEVFDPILSATETRVLEALGCSVLTVNEQGRRCATKPTLFYMPHCEVELYNNLLKANWELKPLNHIVLLGNSFGMYQFMFEFNSRLLDSARHVLAVRRFKEEYAIQMVADNSYYAAFHDLSWHFFSPGIETELQLIEDPI